MPERYYWSKPPEAPLRVELIDRLTGFSVANIFCDEGTWFWKRSTYSIIHGAPPAEGSTTQNLAFAKRKVLEGLPDAR